ncbi:hypothetical protein ACHWQZ_G003239 [Mnemiopsis leidyi]
MSTTLSWITVLLILIARVSLSQGWTELALTTSSGDIETEYLDFSLTKNRVQLQLTQLEGNSDLEFKIETLFFKQELQSSLADTVRYSWNTHSSRTNSLQLDDVAAFEFCSETKSEMLTSIPTEVTIDLNTDYVVEIQDGSQGTFSSATVEPCPEVWTSFKNNRASITKVKVKLTDSDAGYKLESKYMIKYRVIAACEAGQFLGNEGCENCATDHYGAGGWLTSCTQCPTGKGVEAGKGTQESDCTWKPCDAGQYLDQTNGCEDCPVDHWSAAGNTESSCTACPTGKGVAVGSGTQESDCVWKACNAGQYLDQAVGCLNCLEDTWSAGGSVGSCTSCPDGKGVSSGAGNSEDSCTWKPCQGGQYLDQTDGCQNCEADKWSPVGSTSPNCVNCPDGKGVAEGEGKLESDCVWKPCQGGQYLDATNGCQDCPADEWGAVGSTSSKCTECPADKTVAAGTGTKEEDCSWKPCQGGQYLDAAKGCQNCEADHWAPLGSTSPSCSNCPSGKEVAAGEGKLESDCTWKSCTGGQYLDNEKGCENCKAGFYSAGGTVSECTKCDADKYSEAGATQCTECPSGKGVASGDGKQESDCIWKPCSGGQYLDAQTGCQTCEAGLYSAGGTASECTKCDADKYSGTGATQCTDCPSGKGVASGEGKQESDCTWKPCTGGKYLDNEKGCVNCEAGFYSAGGTVSECTKCDADKYSEAGATQCTECPSGKGVARGEGKQESDCTWKACIGGQYLDAKTGCQTCGAGFYSAGGTVSECTKCDADKYSEAGATQCTDCPSGKGVASGEGKQESDCKEIVWKFTSVTLMRVQDDETLTGGNEGILVVSVDNEFHPTTVNFTFCDSGFSNETASLMCTHLGFGGGTFGSSPQNFQYISETLLISKEMPPLSADSCTASYNSTVSAECMAKLKENTGCDLDNTVWIKCAEVIDDRGSSSQKISATVLVTMLNIVFFVIKIC